MFKKILKKDDGSTIGMLNVFLAIMAVAVMIIVMAGFTINMDKLSTVQSIANQYILQMETEGYLPASAKTELLKDLKDAGVVGATLTGTTLTQVAYGAEINLCIQGTYTIDKYNIDDFKLGTTPEPYQINIVKTSTGKH